MKTKRPIVSIYLLLIFLSPPAVFAFASEDILRLLVWEGYTPKEHIQEFEKKIAQKYNRKVKLKISYALSFNDFFDPVRDKKIDLVTVSHSSIKDAQFGYIKKGLFLSPDLKNIPNHAHMIPDLKEADYNYSDGKLYGIPVANGPYGLAYNTSVFKQAPTTWKIFWDPTYKNKYVIGAHEYLYNINITALVMGYSKDIINSFDALNNNAFKKKLRQLAINSGGGWIGIDKPKDFIDMSFGMSWGDSLIPLRRMGEIWKMANPTEGTMWWIDEYLITWALADKPFLKKIAEEWINQSLSTDFQVNHLIREVGVYPVVTNITDKLTKAEQNRFQTDIASTSSTKIRILQHTYSQRDRNGLKLMWDKAMEGVSIKRKDQ